MTTTQQSKKEPSELRRGYHYLEEWIDNGMTTPPNIAFTEGDCRLAAQLIKYATKKGKTITSPSGIGGKAGGGKVPVPETRESSSRTPSNKPSHDSPAGREWDRTLLFTDQDSTPSSSKSKSMNDLYGDGSDHDACKSCGMCRTCGDCTCQ